MQPNGAYPGVLIFNTSAPSFLDLYPAVRASNLLAMSCNAYQCFFQTSTNHTLLEWGQSFYGTRVNMTIDYYTNVITGGTYTGPVVGFTTTGAFHTYWLDPSKTQSQSNYLGNIPWFDDNERLTTMAYARGHACAIRVNGTIVCIGADVDAGELVASTAPTDLTFTAICTQYLAICGILTNGTLYCWYD